MASGDVGGVPVAEASVREIVAKTKKLRAEKAAKTPEGKARAKADAKARKSGLTATTAYREILESGGTTTFTGYTEALTESTANTSRNIAISSVAACACWKIERWK